LTQASRTNPQGAIPILACLTNLGQRILAHADSGGIDPATDGGMALRQN